MVDGVGKTDAESQSLRQAMMMGAMEGNVKLLTLKHQLNPDWEERILRDDIIGIAMKLPVDYIAKPNESP